MPSRPSIFARLQTGVRLKRNQSALFQWFTQNHDEFSAIVDAVSHPSWQSIADELNAEGLTMKDGSALTAPYVRHTWWKADKAYKKGRPTQQVAAPTPEPKPTPSTPSQPPPVFIEEPEEDDFKLTFARPASHKKDKPDV